jgi:hypothetical protein
MRRRSFLLRLFIPVTMVLGLMTTHTACKDKGSEGDKDVPSGSSDCNDVSGLSEAERKVREGFGYEPVASLEERSCRHCKLFIPSSKEKPCGSCLLFKGPVTEQGSCIQFAPKES